MSKDHKFTSQDFFKVQSMKGPASQCPYTSIG